MLDDVKHRRTQRRQYAAAHWDNDPEFDPVIAEEFLKACRCGASMGVAAAFARLSERRIARWLKRGEDRRNEPEHNFRAELSRCMAEMKVGALATWASSNDWRAARALLEQWWPEEFAPAQMAERAEAARAAELAGLQRRKLEAEIALLEAKAKEIPTARVTIDLNPGVVDDLFRQHFGHPGNRADVVVQALSGKTDPEDE